jgi:maltooligosyltrehalose trehalohydrolase
LVSAREYRAAALMLCLSPYTPLLFMGQEWAASTPFYYFTDHGDDLGRRISAGRRREFGSPAQPGAPDDFPDPEAPTTFMASKLNWSELLEPGHAATLARFRAGLAQRRHWLWGSALKRERWTVHQLGDWLAIRYDLGGADRMLLTSLRAVPLSNRPWPDPLALPRGRTWRIVLHSESTAFGGDAQPNFFAAETIVGPATVWLAAVEDGDRHANQ